MKKELYKRLLMTIKTVHVMIYFPHKDNCALEIGLQNNVNFSFGLYIGPKMKNKDI